jgi:hypothetical protein
MARLLALSLVAMLATSPSFAAGLPGQASRNCTIPANVAIDNAKKSAESPFIGIFDGKWEQVLPVTLIIYDVAGGKAYGYYAWKDYRQWNVKAGCRAVLGRIENGVLLFRGDDHMSFTPKGQRLEGFYVYKPGTSEEFIEEGTFFRKR